MLVFQSLNDRRQRSLCQPWVHVSSKHPGTIHGEGMHPNQQVYSQIDVTCPLPDFLWRLPRYIQMARSAVMAPKVMPTQP